MGRRAALLMLCALATFASAFRFTASPGPGLDPDAMSYLGAATAFAQAGAYRIPAAPWSSDSTTAPLVHFPPGYSTVLAVGITTGLEPRVSARLVQGLAAAGTVVFVILILWPITGASGATVAAAGVVLSPAFVLVHLSVLSEPLFLLLLVAALWAMVQRPKSIWVHASIAAAATMVRYAGLSIAGAAALWALRDRHATWRTRLTRAAITMAPSLLLMVVWSTTRKLAPDYARPIRKFAVYGQWGPTLQEGWNSIGHLLTGTLEWNPVPTLAAIGSLVAIAALAWVAFDRSGDTGVHTQPVPVETRRTLHAIAVLALCYVGLVVASRLLADPLIPFDFRLAAPLVPLATIAVAVTAARAWVLCSTPARVFGILAVLLWGASAVMSAQEHISYNLTEGSDFAGREWRESPTLAWVARERRDRPIFTNWPCAIWFHLGQSVRDVPDDIDVRSAKTMQKFVETVRRRGGVVVLWSMPSGETAAPDAIVSSAGLVRVAQFADGAIYEAPAPAVAAPLAPAAAKQ